MKNKSHIFLIVLVTFFISSMLVSAEPVTETVCDETFVLEYGYLWMITKRTPALNTSVTITIDSDKMVDFYISDVGETEKYVEGQDTKPDTGIGGGRVAGCGGDEEGARGRHQQDE